MPRIVLAAVTMLIFFSLSCEEAVHTVIDETESPDDPDVIPRVVYTYPPANSVGPYPDIYINPCRYWCESEKRLQLRFNKYMDIATVRGSIRISSPHGDVRVEPNLVLPVGGDIFLITPVDPTGSRYAPPSFAIGDTYTLIVDTTALDIHGNRLAAPYSMTFVPEPFFRVRGMYPDSGDTVTSIYTQPRVRFNSVVDQEILSHLHLTPPDSGHWVVYSGGLAVDYAGAHRSYGTTYSVEVDAGATDSDGRLIDRSYEYSFPTVPFVISYSVPADGNSGVSLTGPLNFFPTVYPDWGTLPGAFRISPMTPGMFIAYSGPSGAPIEFWPTEGFTASTSYSVTIDTSLRATNGQPLGQPYEISFVTGPFGVDSTLPAEGDSSHPTSAWVRVYCNARLDVTTIRGAVSISPSLLLTFSATEPTSMFMLHAYGLFQTKTTYTVTVDTTLLSSAGSRMDAPYVFTFTTE